MNKNTIVIAIVVVLLVIAGIVYYEKGTAVSPTGTDTTNGAGSTGGAASDNGGVTTHTTTTTTTSSATRKAGVPLVVTNATASPTDTTVALTGTITPNGSLTTYWYEYGLNSNFGHQTEAQTIGSGFLTVKAPAYVVGLTKSTTYTFRLVAQNQYGKVLGDQYTFKTTSVAGTPVGAVPVAKTLEAGTIAINSANLNGQVTPSKAATVYWFEYGKTSAMGESTAVMSAGDGSVAVNVSVPVTGLDPGSTYYYRIITQNQFGTVVGTAETFITTGQASK